MEELQTKLTPAQKAARRAALDKNVSKDWKPIESLQNRPSKMAFSDRLYYWFLMMGGLGLAAAGVAWVYMAPVARRFGFTIVAGGLVMFALSFPSAAARNGYRD